MFAQRLKELRTERQLSQSDLASALNISNRTISMYEQENSEPNIEILIKIAKYFGVSADYLLGLTNVKEINPEVSFMSNYLGLSERTIKELHEYAFYSQKNNHIKQKLDTLNLLFSPECEILDHITDYINFSATHFKDFYDDNLDSIKPISSLELWDDKEKVGYSDDWDMWSKALLLIVEEELIYFRQKYQERRYHNDETPTD